MNFRLFPFEKIDQGSRLVIYGAGLICLEYLAQVEKTGHCRVVAVLDRNHGKFVNFPLPVLPPEAVSGLSGYDHVLLTMASPQYVGEAREFLISHGVPEERILDAGDRVVFVNENWLSPSPEQRHALRQIRRARRPAAAGFSPPRREPAALDIAVTLNGGLGDYLQSSNYLKEIYKFAGCECRFHILAHRDPDEFRAIFSDYPFVKGVHFFGPGQLQAARRQPCFDAALDISRCPQLIRWSEKRVASLSPRLARLFRTIRDFPYKNFNLYRPLQDTLWTIYSLANGRRRSNQYDLDGVLGMRADVQPLMLVDPASLGVLERNGLEPGRYVTLQRGVVKYTDQRKSARLWPLPHYHELAALLKKSFPGLALVMLGEAARDISAVKGVDLDLRGRTGFGELKALLKHSVLHIDGECGMVHMRHALNGKSAVFFGQTRPDFTGYPDNLNMLSGACPVWCEWVTDQWLERCPRGFDQPPCLAELTPALVMEFIGEELALRLREAGRWRWKSAAAPAWSGGGRRVVLIGGEKPGEARKYARSGCRTLVLGLDIDPARLARAARGGYELEFAGLYNLPLPDASADLIVWDPAAGDPVRPDFALREMRRVLREGGVLALRRLDGCPGLRRELEKIAAAPAPGGETFIRKRAAGPAGRRERGA